MSACFVHHVGWEVVGWCIQPCMHVDYSTFSGGFRGNGSNSLLCMLFTEDSIFSVTTILYIIIAPNPGSVCHSGMLPPPPPLPPCSLGTAACMPTCRTTSIQFIQYIILKKNYNYKVHTLNKTTQLAVAAGAAAAAAAAAKIAS